MGIIYLKVQICWFWFDFSK